MRKNAAPFFRMYEPPNRKLLTRRELAIELGQSLSTIARWQRGRVVPFLKVRGWVRFNLAAVERALAKYERKEIE